MIRSDLYRLGWRAMTVLLLVAGVFLALLVMSQPAGADQAADPVPDATSLIGKVADPETAAGESAGEPPAQSETAVTEPVATEPVATEPAVTEPTESEPAAKSTGLLASVESTVSDVSKVSNVAGHSSAQQRDASPVASVTENVVTRTEPTAARPSQTHASTRPSQPEQASTPATSLTDGATGIVRTDAVPATDDHADAQTSTRSGAAEPSGLVGSLVPPVTDAALSDAGTAAPVGRLVGTVSPVVDQVVGPVVDPVVHTVVAPVVDPVVRTVVAPVVDGVVTPVVGSATGVVGPVVGSTVQLAGSVVDPVVGPLVGPVLGPVLSGGSVSLPIALPGSLALLPAAGSPSDAGTSGQGGSGAAGAPSGWTPAAGVSQPTAASPSAGMTHPAPYLGPQVPGALPVVSADALAGSTLVGGAGADSFRVDLPTPPVEPVPVSGASSSGAGAGSSAQAGVLVAVLAVALLCLFVGRRRGAWRPIWRTYLPAVSPA